MTCEIFFRKGNFYLLNNFFPQKLLCTCAQNWQYGGKTEGEKMTEYKISYHIGNSEVLFRPKTRINNESGSVNVS